MNVSSKLCNPRATVKGARKVFGDLFRKPELVTKKEMDGERHASRCIHTTLCLCVEGTGEPEGSGQQSQAAHAESSSRGFKQAPACNMDETQAPCRTMEDLGPFLDLTVTLSMCM